MPSKTTNATKTSDETLQFYWDRMIEYLKEGDYRQAVNSIMSDLNKTEYGNKPSTSVILMSIMGSTSSTTIIKMIAGFAFMPQNIKKFYDNPLDALK